jgi:hypothetical protein
MAKNEKKSEEFEFVYVGFTTEELRKLGLSTATKRDARSDVRKKFGLAPSSRKKKVLGLTMEQIAKLNVKPNEDGKYSYKELAEALTKKAGI